MNAAQALATAILIPLAVAFLVALQRRSLREYGAGVEDPPVHISHGARTMARFALRAKQVGYVVRIRNGGLELTHPNAPRAKAVVRSSSPHTVFLWRRTLDKYGQEVIGQSDKSTPCTYDEAGVLIGVWFRESGPR